MSLESIETLRIWSKAHMCSDSEIWRFIDAVEREISERYVELPLDADGVPICVDDLLRLPNGKVTAVRFITFNDAGWLINDSGWFPDRVTHYQHDSWERIIEDAMAYKELPTDMDVQLLVDRCRALAGED